MLLLLCLQQGEGDSSHHEKDKALVDFVPKQRERERERKGGDGWGGRERERRGEPRREKE